MHFLNDQIRRARTADFVLRCRTPGGKPLADLAVSAEQVAGDFFIGARWSGEGPTALAHLARLPGPALLAASWTPLIRAAFAEAALTVQPILLAPTAGRSLHSWCEQVAEPGLERVGDYPHVAGWAVEAGWAECDPRAVQRAVDFLRERTGRPVALLGLRLPFDQPPADADAYGICLGGDAGPMPHLAVLRRGLLAFTEQHGPAFLYDAGCPRLGDPEYRRPARRLGGAERVEADFLAQLATVAFSVPRMLGVYLAWVAAPAIRERTSLLDAELSPKPSYKVLKQLVGDSWQTRVNGRTDAEGTFRWYGYAGEYRLCLTDATGAVHVAARRAAPAGAGSIVDLGWEIQATGAP